MSSATYCSHRKAIPYPANTARWTTALLLARSTPETATLIGPPRPAELPDGTGWPGIVDDAGTTGQVGRMRWCTNLSRYAGAATRTRPKVLTSRAIADESDAQERGQGSAQTAVSSTARVKSKLRPKDPHAPDGSARLGACPMRLLCPRPLPEAGGRGSASRAHLKLNSGAAWCDGTAAGRSAPQVGRPDGSPLTGRHWSRVPPPKTTRSRQSDRMC